MLKTNIVRWTRMVAGVASLAIAAVAVAAEPIKIGSVLSLTGPAAYLGEPGLKTLQVYIDKVNAEGGLLGRKLQLVHYDDGGDAAKANAFVKRLIDDDKVDVILGGSTTGSTMSMVPSIEKAGIPYIAIAGGAVIVDPVKKWVFKTPHTDRMVAERVLSDMRKRGFTRFALLSETSGFGQSGRKEAKALASGLGLSIVVDETFGPKDTDMTPQLTKVRTAQGVQAVFVFGTGPAPAIVTRNFAQMGIKLALYQSHGSASDEYIRLAGPASEGVRLAAAAFIVASSLPDSDPQKSVALSYGKVFSDRWKTPVDVYGAQAYDAFLLMTNAIRRADSTDKEKVRAALEQTRGLVGLDGIFNMSPTDHLGLSLDSLRMLEVKDGQFRLAEHSN